MRKCAVVWCDNKAISRGWCNKHYQRWRQTGDPLVTKITEFGKAASALEDMLLWQTDDCIPWPFGKSSAGYGRIVVAGKTRNVTSVVCERIYGPRPSRNHEVAHSCHNPPCINHKHLRWATKAENSADRVADGTDNRGERHGSVKLSEIDVLNIRAEYAKKDITELALANFFNISQLTVSNIVTRKRWSHVA